MIQRLIQVFNNLKETLFGARSTNISIQNTTASKCRNSCSRNTKKNKKDNLKKKSTQKQ